MGVGRGQFQRHFGSDQSVWRDGDWNGFVRIALAGLLAHLSSNWHGILEDGVEVAVLLYV